MEGAGRRGDTRWMLECRLRVVYVWRQVRMRVRGGGGGFRCVWGVTQTRISCDVKTAMRTSLVCRWGSGGGGTSNIIIHSHTTAGQPWVELDEKNKGRKGGTRKICN